MSRLRLLAASLLASEFALIAAAQSPTQQHPAPWAGAIPSSPILNEAPSAPVSPTSIERLKDLPALRTQKALAAQAQAPCYTLRSYNFTERDLKSAHPHASNEIDCTPAAKGRLLANVTAISTSLTQPVPNLQPHRGNRALHSQKVESQNHNIRNVQTQAKKF